MEKEDLRYKLNIQLFGENFDEDESEDLDEDDFEEEDEDDETDEDIDQSENREKSKTQKKPQSAEENARQAEVRRQKEQKEKIREAAYQQGLIDATKVNKFTNQPISDEYDLSIYKVQLELESQGKDPIKDLAFAMAKKSRDDAKSIEEKNKQKAQEDEKIKQDMNAFVTKYPNVNVEKLLKDPQFDKYAKGKWGIVPLSQIYEDFNELKESLGQAISQSNGEKKMDESAKRKGMAPSSNGGPKKEQTPYSKLPYEERIKVLKKQGLII